MFASAKRKNKIVDILKSLLLFSLLVAVIAASFWISFLLGRRILIPVKKMPQHKIEAAIPEPPPSIAALQKLEAISKEPQKAAEVTTTTAIRKTAVKEKPAAYRTGRYYKVQAGLYVDRDKAQELADKLNDAGIATYIKKVSSGWRVQVGAFKKKSQALDLQGSLSAKGFPSVLVYE